MKISHEQTEKLIEQLFQLERSGRYEEAISKLGDIWKDKTKKPKVDNFEPKLAAETLLRCGSLIGFLGHNKQIPDSQEQSRDLLTESRNSFLKIYDFEKVAECENYIALTYRRTGELNEAEIWIDEALSRDISISSDTKLYSLLIKSMLDISNEKSEQAISDLNKAKPFFIENGDHFLNGSFCTNLGLALKNLNFKSEALKQFELAKQFHQKSKHQIYLGTVQNNIAQIYKLDKNFDKAHLAINIAYKVFKEINDRTREGFSLDTKAQIYLAEEKYQEALVFANKAIKILKSSENSAYLVEAYLTKIKVLVTTNDILQASSCLADATLLAKTQIGEEANNKIIQEFNRLITKKISPVFTNLYDEERIIVEGFMEEVYEKGSELVLPVELRGFKELIGVNMTNDHLREAGLKEGELAIIAEEAQIKRGDLIAIMELENEQVHCGFYGADMGFISLEKPEAEVQIFNENEIRILGKIVGVADRKDAQGRSIIRLI